MFATQKRILIAATLFCTLTAAIAKPVAPQGLVLDVRNGADTLRLKDSGPFKNTGKAIGIAIPNSPSLVSMQDTRQLTLAVWIKPNSISQEFPVIISKGAHNTAMPSGGYELTLNANGDNDVVFYIGGFCAYTGAANGSLVNNHLGEWIHLAVTVDATAQTVQIYVNGQAFSNIVTYGTLADAKFDVANDLYIGTEDPGASPSMATFDGTIRQVQIYNRALSANEIQKIFSSTKPK
jgi:hypothetical protein